MSEREKAREEARRKDAERKKKVNTWIALDVVLMFLAFNCKDSHPYSWVILIPACIFCFLWSFANSDF